MNFVKRPFLAPQSTAYNSLGQDCVNSGCSVDLFVFNNSYIDLATIGQVARMTGGGIFKYTYFQAEIDGQRLVADVIKNISRPIAFDTVMRVRTSTGTRPTDFYGHFFMSNTTDMEIASFGEFETRPRVGTAVTEHFSLQIVISRSRSKSSTMTSWHRKRTFTFKLRCCTRQWAASGA